MNFLFDNLGSNGTSLAKGKQLEALPVDRIGRLNKRDMVVD